MKGAPVGQAIRCWCCSVLLLLQSLYGLSERELEEALGDRLSFQRFVGLSLEDAAPDHTVLNRFRNQLVAKAFWRSCLANWIGSWRMPA